MTRIKAGNVSIRHGHCQRSPGWPGVKMGGGHMGSIHNGGVYVSLRV